MPQMIKFPSIEQFRTVVKVVRDASKKYEVPVPKVTFKGTIKLHGTNASVVDTKKERWAQSRERIITPIDDNMGFAKFAKERNNLFDILFSVARFVADPLTTISEERPIAVFGEWCGKGIQGGVGISQVEKMFVIFGISLGTEDDRYWLTEDQLEDVFTGMDNNIGRYDIINAQQIYSIYQFPTYSVEIDFANPEFVQNQLGEITLAVEAECPVAKYFGVAGVGEGVVWSSTDPGHNRFLRFKVKGEKHSVSKVKTLAAVDIEKVNSINELVEKVVTENRLKQMKDKLVELGLNPNDIKNMGQYLKLLGTDVLKEEADTIEASNLTKNDVMGKVNRVGRDWFIANIG